MNKLLKVYLAGVELSVCFYAFGIGVAFGNPEKETAVKTLRYLKTRPFESAMVLTKSCALWPIELVKDLSRTKHTK